MTWMLLRKKLKLLNLKFKLLTPPTCRTRSCMTWPGPASLASSQHCVSYSSTSRPTGLLWRSRCASYFLPRVHRSAVILSLWFLSSHSSPGQHFSLKSLLPWEGLPLHLLQIWWFSRSWLPPTLHPTLLGCSILTALLICFAVWNLTVIYVSQTEVLMEGLNSKLSWLERKAGFEVSISLEQLKGCGSGVSSKKSSSRILAEIVAPLWSPICGVALGTILGLSFWGLNHSFWKLSNTVRQVPLCLSCLIQVLLSMAEPWLKHGPSSV